MHSLYKITSSRDFEVGYNGVLNSNSFSVYDAINLEDPPTKCEPGAGVQCDICWHVLPTAQKLVTHRRVHAMELNYTCLICHGIYEDKSQLETHVQQMHACADTVDDYLTGTNIEPVIIKNEPAVGGDIQCDICQHLLPTAQKLITHRCVHAMELNYTCLICYGTYEDKTQLYTHIQQMHACADITNHMSDNNIKPPIIKEEPGIGVGVQCDICPQLLPSEQKLIAHRRIHAMELTYTCLMCRETYDDRTQLNTHIKQMHACAINANNTKTIKDEVGAECDICHLFLPTGEEKVVSERRVQALDGTCTCRMSNLNTDIQKMQACANTVDNDIFAIIEESLIIKEETVLPMAEELVSDGSFQAMDRSYTSRNDHQAYDNGAQLNPYSHEMHAYIDSSQGTLIERDLLQNNRKNTHPVNNCPKIFDNGGSKTPADLTLTYTICSDGKSYECKQINSKKCHVCHKLLNRRDILSGHMCTHTNEKPIAATINTNEIPIAANINTNGMPIAGTISRKERQIAPARNINRMPITATIHTNGIPIAGRTRIHTTEKPIAVAVIRNERPIAPARNTNKMPIGATIKRYERLIVPAININGMPTPATIHTNVTPIAATININKMPIGHVININGKPIAATTKIHTIEQPITATINRNELAIAGTINRNALLIAPAINTVAGTIGATINNNRMPIGTTINTNGMPIAGTINRNAQLIAPAINTNRMPITATINNNGMPIGTAINTNGMPIGTTINTNGMPIAATINSNARPIGFARNINDTLVPAYIHTNGMPITAAIHTSIIPIAVTIHMNGVPIAATINTNGIPIAATIITNGIPIAATINTNGLPIVATINTNGMPIATTINAKEMTIAANINTNGMSITATIHTNGIPISATINGNGMPLAVGIHSIGMPIAASIHTDEIPIAATISTSGVPIAATINANGIPIAATINTNGTPIAATINTNGLPIAATIHTNGMPINTTIASNGMPTAAINYNGMPIAATINTNGMPIGATTTINTTDKPIAATINRNKRPIAPVINRKERLIAPKIITNGTPTAAAIFTNEKSDVYTINLDDSDNSIDDATFEENSYKCIRGHSNKCRKLFGSKDNLKSHICINHTKAATMNADGKSVTPRRDNSTQCHICHKILSTKGHLTRHIKNVHSNEATTIDKNLFEHEDAHLYNKTLNREGRDILKKLNIEETYKCTYCHKQFNRRVSLKTHMRAHTEENPEAATNDEWEAANDAWEAANEEWEADNDEWEADNDEWEAGNDVWEAGNDVWEAGNEQWIIPYGDNSIECYICHKIFSRMDNVRRHIKNVHSNRATLINKDLFKHVMDTHLYNNNRNKILSKEDSDSFKKLDVDKTYECIFCHKCKICHKLFGRKDNLTRHMHDTHNGQMLGECNVPIERITQHIQNKECEHTHLKCTICKHSVIEHMPRRAGQKLFECKICHNMCKMQMFDNTYTPSTTREKLTCLICFKKYNRKNKLVIHMRTHSGEKPYLCDKCPKQFHISACLELHMTTHADIKFECDICHKTFKWKKSLLRHIHEHKRLTVKRNRNLHVCTYSDRQSFECLICKKLFTLKIGLKAHIGAHSGHKPYKCEVCHKTFSRKSSLWSHKQVHSEQGFECLICHKLLKWKMGLIIHMRTHTGEKPYECDACHRKFTQPTALINHKNIHTGQKSYECDICHKLFRWMPNLELHRRIHTGEEPYQCSFCDKRFKTSSNLSCHIRSHHIF